MKAIGLIGSSLVTAGLVLAAAAASWNPYDGEPACAVGPALLGLALLVIGATLIGAVAPEGRRERRR